MNDEAYLVPESSPLQRHRLGPLTSLGRHPDNTLEIPDRSVSKFHAQIQHQPDGSFVLQDLGSRNGTYVAGQRVQRHDLDEGEELTLGTVRFRFHVKRAVMTSGTVALSTGGMTMLGPAGTHTGGRHVALADGPGGFAASNTFQVEDDRFLPSDQIDDVDSLRRDYEKLRIAHELGSAMRLDLPIEELLQTIAERVFELLSADRCAILLMNKDGVSLEPILAIERGLGEPKEAIRLSQTVLAEVVANKKAVLSTDAATDGRFQASASIVALSIRSAMAVPLIYDQQLFGVIHVDSQQRRGAFTPKDLQIFGSLANRAAAALKNASLVREIAHETETRARLGRLLSPNLVEEVVSGKLDLAPGGQKRRAAVMFTDIRGFTSISEQLDADEVTALLNEYFEVMVDVLFAHHGTLDKYMGDGMMALFGVPKDDDRASENAVRCGLKMQQALRTLNRTRESRGQRALAIGIGVTVGEVIWGPLGSRKTMDYTVVGDVVNTSSRLCAAAKPGAVLIGQQAREEIGSTFQTRELPPATLKGKAEPVRVFEVLGEAEAT